MHASSASFYPPQHPANPKPGAWYLKHVGFLGAHKPAIKGLKPVQLADDDQGVVTVNFAETDNFPNQEEEARVAEEDLAARESALTQRETELKAREAAEAKRVADVRHGAAVAFAEGLVADAKLAPAGKELVIGLFDQLDAASPVSFGEAGELAPADALRKLLDGAQPLIDLGVRGDKPAGDASYVSFAAPAGYEVDPAQDELYAKAVKVQQGNPDLAWIDCVKRAQATG